MSYIQSQQELDGWAGDLLDKIKDVGSKVGGALVEGVKNKYTPAPPAPAAKEPTFMDKYGTFVIVGGVAVAGVVAYKALKK